MVIRALQVAMILCTLVPAVLAADPPAPKQDDGQRLKLSLPAPKKAAESDAAAVTYNGKPRSRQWLNEQYAYFKGRVALVDGKFLDIGRAVQGRPSEMTDKPPAPGSELRYLADGMRVLQVIDKDTAIVDRPHIAPTPAIVATESRFGSGILVQGSAGQAGITCRLNGMDTSRWVNDMQLFPIKELLPKGSQLPFPKPRQQTIFVFIGTHQYRTILGASNTIQDYALLRDLTREEFVKALEGGFELVKYQGGKSVKVE